MFLSDCMWSPAHGADPSAADAAGNTPLSQVQSKEYTGYEPRPDELDEAQRISMAMGVPLRVEASYPSLIDLFPKLKRRASKTKKKKKKTQKKQAAKPDAGEL